MQLYRSTKVEKVRGMNASLANDLDEMSGRPSRALKERDAPKMHIGTRQVVLAVVFAAAGVAAAVYTVDAVTAGPANFPAVSSSAAMYDLNFANPGLVTSIDVSIGQRVRVGQVLARQDAATLQTQVQQDQAAVDADKQAVANTQTPQLSTAQREQLALQVQQAQAQLNTATANLDAVRSTGQASVGAAQQSVGTEQQILSADQNQLAILCPTGGPATPTCVNLQTQVSKDAANLESARNQVPVAEAQAQQAFNIAAGNVDNAQSALSLAQNQLAALSSPASPTAIAQAETSLSQAQVQLAQAQEALNEATLQAPDSGIVTAVFGAIGEYVGPDGVRQYQAPSTPQTNKTPTFNLFPVQGSSSSQSATSGTEPLIQIAAGNQSVTAQIGESSVSHFPVGHHAVVTVNALHQQVPATVSQVVLDPSRSSGQAVYDVIFRLDQNVTGLLPGMSASVSN